MGTAICLTCGAKSTSDDKETAISLLNHAVGRTRGINCGGNLARVETSGFKIILEPTPKSTIPESKTIPTETKPTSSKESKKVTKPTSSKESKKVTKSTI